MKFQTKPPRDCLFIAQQDSFERTSQCDERDWLAVVVGWLSHIRLFEMGSHLEGVITQFFHRLNISVECSVAPVIQDIVLFHYGRLKQGGFSVIHRDRAYLARTAFLSGPPLRSTKIANDFLISFP